MSSFVPDLVEFSRLCVGATVVPVSREILADVITPVAAKATVGSAPGSFLLESVVGGEKWARFSFVGFDPELIVRGVADVFERIEGGKIVREEGVDPWMRLRDTMSRYVPAEAPFLPRWPIRNACKASTLSGSRATARSTSSAMTLPDPSQIALSGD